MTAAAKRILRHLQMLGAMLLALFFASRFLGNSGWIGYLFGALLCTGFVLNTLVTTLNGGYMPIAADLEGAPDKYRDQYKSVDGATRLGVLGDWINLGPWLVSPGDILLALGFIGTLAGTVILAG